MDDGDARTVHTTLATPNHRIRFSREKNAGSTNPRTLLASSPWTAQTSLKRTFSRTYTGANEKQNWGTNVKINAVSAQVYKRVVSALNHNSLPPLRLCLSPLRSCESARTVVSDSKMKLKVGLTVGWSQTFQTEIHFQSHLEIKIKWSLRTPFANCISLTEINARIAGDGAEWHAQSHL